MPEIVAYASRTGTRRNLAALRAAGWRLLVSAAGVWRTEGFPYALDNGAWTAAEEYRKGLRASPLLDLGRFREVVRLLGAGADFIVVPDIVQGGERSWLLTRYWLRKLRRDRRLRRVVLLIAVQDGFDPAAVAPYLGARVGVFVGGSTDWKLATMGDWCRVAHAAGARCHVARVNTVRRIRAAIAVGADSFDGSSVSRYACNLHRLDLARRQPDLLGRLAA